MACQVTVYVNVFASSIETDIVPFDDQENIQSNNDYIKFSRMCSFVVKRGNHERYVEDLCSLKHRLCRQGSHLVTDHDTGCRVSLDPLQIEGIIQTISVRVGRMMLQNLHREKMPFVATCDVILPRYEQPWQRKAAMGTVDFSDFGVVSTMKATVDLIEKRKGDKGFDDDNLKLGTGLEQFVNGCKRSREC
ncbi:hypothetical protein ACJRO7_025641 [Eucalyptus globulus]|uniref:Uncharacterized protein n=1 Tax=Eucalyptus globulus TaxID=34317 RepID=A0ABD3KDF1_EUCGL